MPALRRGRRVLAGRGGREAARRPGRGGERGRSDSFAPRRVRGADLGRRARLGVPQDARAGCGRRAAGRRPRRHPLGRGDRSSISSSTSPCSPRACRCCCSQWPGPELLERRPSWPVTLRLEPLAEDAVEELLPATLAPGLRERIVRAAGGNPLFVHEMVAMAAATEGEVTVPPTLQALLAARLDQLDRPERTVLEWGAVEGEIFHRGSVFAGVPRRAEHEAEAAVIAGDRHRGALDRGPAAVGAPDARDDGVDLVAGDDPGDLGRRPGGVVRVDEVQDRRARQVDGLPAEAAPRGRRPGDRARGVDERDEVVRVLEGEPAHGLVDRRGGRGLERLGSAAHDAPPGLDGRTGVVCPITRLRIRPASDRSGSRPSHPPRATGAAAAARPCTTTIRGGPSEVLLEPGDDPVPRTPVVNLDSVESVSLANSSNGSAGAARGGWSDLSSAGPNLALYKPRVHPRRAAERLVSSSEVIQLVADRDTLGS